MKPVRLAPALAPVLVMFATMVTFSVRSSNGIKDLRHGNLLDEDWLDHDPEHPHNVRHPVPLHRHRLDRLLRLLPMSHRLQSWVRSYSRVHCDHSRRRLATSTC